MEKLNNKIKNGRTELINDAQMVALYGYDATADQLRRLTCDNTGKLDIEATLELDSSGLAKESKQDTIINATIRDINNTGSLGDGQSNATSVCLGYDRSNGKGRAILVDANGKVEVNSTMNSGHGLATETKQDTLIANQTNGTQQTKCMGSEDPNDPSATQKQLHLDGSGNIQANVVNTINIAPANTLNSGITNDPVNSVAVGLRARQTITDASTETFLKCNASGELLTSGGGGGGSSTYTLEQQSAPHNTLQIIGDGNGNQYIDTNGGSKFVVIVQSGSGAGSPVVSLEWSDNTSFSVNQVVVCNGFASGLALTSSIPLQGTSRADSSTLTTQAILFFDTIPARYVRITIIQTSGGAITYTGKTALSP